jgi:hypothetical protein
MLEFPNTTSVCVCMTIAYLKNELINTIYTPYDDGRGIYKSLFQIHLRSFAGSRP